MRLIFKNSIKKILKSFGRFISISIIILIGIGVFTGLKEATPGMLHTADNYYDTHNLMDFKITSTLGLNGKDITSLKNLKNVEKVIPSYSLDVLSNGQPIRVHAIEEEINNVYLIDGKMPANNSECLGDTNKYKIGDTITLDENNDYLKIKECKIVGTIKSVLYLTSDYGISSLGDGSLSSFIFIPKESFDIEYYTEAYLIGTNTKNNHSYESEYEENKELLKSELIKLKPIREKERYEEIIKELNNINQNIEIENLGDTLNIEKPTWYILDRNDIPGYQNYKNDCLKVEAISSVLPLFFIIVVMLMCLNTLTRLIEEERTEIGIFESNGFNKISIILSYLYYVFTSTMLGITLGLILGYQIISKIIYGVFTANYYLPDYLILINKSTLFIIIFTTVFLMMLVTIIAVNKELKDKPSELLRPKPPKSGKKIFLEHFKNIWSKLSFMSKITIRNLFRYKKRIFMTILGVAGCTALLLTGFGLNDSINVISKIQYNDIIKYKSMITLKEEITELSPKLKSLLNETEYLLLNQNAYSFTYDNTKETAYIIVPENEKEINKYISLKSTLTDTEINLQDDGVIITKQISDELGITKGDTFLVKDSENKEYTLKVNDITYNYVTHYIYMNKEYYQEIFNTNIKYNNIVTKHNIDDKIDLNSYGIYMINSTSSIIDTFDTFITSINKLITLIVVCACLLAFAVLYNLTIINVMERKREIATFKVLGFNDKEIFMFIYRETLLLTILGSLLGLILGIYLHKFVISKTATGSILFICNIEWYSFILSIIITVVFSLLVELLINRTLKKIDMIDSLKSVE